MVENTQATNQETPVHRDPCAFPCFRNISPPHIATLSLPWFTIGLPVWLFSTPVVSLVLDASHVHPPPQEHPPQINPLPSSPIMSSSLYSPSFGESIATSNQAIKKKQKQKNKKKKAKKWDRSPAFVGHSRGNQPATVDQDGSVDLVHKPRLIRQKPK